ncbi:serine/threonine-protein kinase [Streptomyces liangshanensis]|uniref:non-specific serine/threonine protein kinase n=1 Tax=Streptomyces liangshanensis TaxID=2717324 RepID=A0A6G9GZX2_9ACTN|nr:serine/threonine-protein kinase [Streptomyces liangshanensis]QIQ03795.1 protein kinase [Streptomyces liangshanensis]
MGEVFAGRYELVDPIGRGGAGAVWRAWDHRRRRYVAAKVLQQSDAHALLRFVREQALRIDHPHVLAPASWSADDDKVLFTMALVSGGSLAHVIGDYGPLPPPFVCTLLDQLLSGLAAVHAEGVVHRDIKPANILMEATGKARPHLRLSDFGIAMRKGEPRLTETDYVLGTPGYFAPEQMMGAEPDFPADLFAAGLVALYLLQGRKPDARALIEYFAAHGTPGAPQGIPEPLWQVLAGLLQPDPRARFRTATGARKALAAALELLPEPDTDDEPVEIFDQIGPLPVGFGPSGPLPAPPPEPAPTTGGGGRRADYGPGHDSGHGSGHDPGHGSMSDTGSFHLPPPPVRAEPQQSPTPLPPPHQPQPQPQPRPEGQPLPPPPLQPYGPAPAPSHAPTVAVQPYEPAPTAPYTTRTPEVPPPHTPPGHTRPGPPPKVTIPVLLLALACFAVGIWALTHG